MVIEAAQRKKAVNFGKDQVGKSYGIKTTLITNNKWYYSKLTYRQWSNAGYDLKGPGGTLIGGYTLVIPLDIRLDANTRLIKNWKTSLPGKL